MGALERVTRALAAMTPGPWLVTDISFGHAEVFIVIPGTGGLDPEPPSSEALFGLGDGAAARVDAEAIATLRNDTAQALAEARAEGVRATWRAAAEALRREQAGCCPGGDPLVCVLCAVLAARAADFEAQADPGPGVEG
jgi:hypothetical protein